MLTFDELNAYEYADKVVKAYSLKFIRMFNRCKAWKNKKPKDIIDDFFEFYEDLYEMALVAYLDIARHYYQPDHKATKIDRKWVDKFLNRYDPIAKYIFKQETDRKRSRHTEAVIASETPDKETDTALRYWSNMFRQFADAIADAAFNQGLKDDEIKKVRWRTEQDNRVCLECKAREGKIYPISQVPPKPHIGCRCWLEKANG